MVKKRRYVALAIVASIAVAALGFFVFRAGTKQEVTQGPFTADGRCPTFRPRYAQAQVRFGNQGLSVLNSLYETFVGEGAFEISEFTVSTNGDKRFTIVAQSNRGELTSEINADRVVRLGQDRENEQLRRTHQSAFCHAGRIYEHQVVDLGNGKFIVQDLEYWTEGEVIYFRLYQNRRLTAEVVGR